MNNKNNRSDNNKNNKNNNRDANRSDNGPSKFRKAAYRRYGQGCRTTLAGFTCGVGVSDC